MKVIFTRSGHFWQVISSLPCGKADEKDFHRQKHVAFLDFALLVRTWTLNMGSLENKVKGLNWMGM